MDSEKLIKFSHLDDDGNVHMVDISDKNTTVRTATASGVIQISPSTAQAIKNDVSLPKGNVLTTAKIAGISAAKKCSELIPLCHPLQLTHVDLIFEIGEDEIRISALARAKDATGVEMEALTAVSVAALTIYDMCKAVDKNMVISQIELKGKHGGKSSQSTTFRPRVGILVLSDTISNGDGNDRSGALLKTGFKTAGCAVDKFKIIPDEATELLTTVIQWKKAGVQLIITSGGTGLGPRDITIDTLTPQFTRHLPGIEMALHDQGRKSIPTAILSRLAAGAIDETIVVCLPGSTGAARDALAILIPTIFHAFHMQNGEKH